MSNLTRSIMLPCVWNKLCENKCILRHYVFGEMFHICLLALKMPQSIVLNSVGCEL